MLWPLSVSLGNLAGKLSVLIDFAEEFNKTPSVNPIDSGGLKVDVLA
jgi:hypothetical protein